MVTTKTLYSVPCDVLHSNLTQMEALSMERIRSPNSFHSTEANSLGLAQTILKGPTCHNYSPSFWNPAGERDSGSASAVRACGHCDLFSQSPMAHSDSLLDMWFSSHCVPLPCPQKASLDNLSSLSQWAQPDMNLKLFSAQDPRSLPSTNCNCLGSWGPFATSLWRVFSVLLRRSLYDWNLYHWRTL